MSKLRRSINIGEYGPKIAALTGGIAAIAGIVISVKAGLPVTKIIDGQKIADVAETAVKTGSKVAKEAAKVGEEVAKDAVSAASDSKRYIVQRKALKTGEWYDVTSTDHKPSAFSVATTTTWGRASRVIDTLENVIHDVAPGDPSSYAQYKE